MTTCQPGTFQDEEGAAVCKICGDGKYQDLTGGQTCKDCELPCGLDCTPCRRDTGLCTTREGFCAIDNTCYEPSPKPLGSLATDACLGCHPTINARKWTGSDTSIYQQRCQNLQKEKGPCTHSFACVKSLTTKETFFGTTINTTTVACMFELIGDDVCRPDNGLEECTGLKSPPCRIVPEIANFVHRTGVNEYYCILESGEHVKHGTVNPDNSCQECDVYWIRENIDIVESTGVWKPLSGKVCDDHDLCTYSIGEGINGMHDTCSDTGQCRGIERYECLVPDEHVCQEASTCLGNGACRDTFYPATKECRSSSSDCDPLERCTGFGGACPVDVTEVPVWGSDATITLLGAHSEDSYHVVRSESPTVTVVVNNASVSCGEVSVWVNMVLSEEGEECNVGTRSGASSAQTISSDKPVTLSFTYTAPFLQENFYSPEVVVQFPVIPKVYAEVQEEPATDCSQLFMHDAQPPRCGPLEHMIPQRVDDFALTKGLDFSRYTTVDLSLNCSDGSGIDATYFGIGSAPGLLDIRDWSAVEEQVGQTVTLDLTPFLGGSRPVASPVFIQGRIIDAGGFDTTIVGRGLVVDLSDPIPGTVSEGMQGWEYLNMSIDEFPVVYGGFNDPEAPISHYDWRLCHRAPGSQDVQGCTEWERIGGSPVLVRSPTPLISGREYYHEVRATNVANRQSTARSDGFLADFVPPAVTAVSLHDKSGGLLSCTSEDQVEVDWSPFEEDHSGMKSYRVCIVVDDESLTTVRCKTVLPSGHTKLSVTFSGLDLSTGMRYRASVAGTDHALHESTVNSKSFLFDTTPPDVSHASVTVSHPRNPGARLAFQNFSGNLSAVWQGVVDADGLLTSARACIGTALGSCDVAAWRALWGPGVASSTLAPDNGRLLKHGVVYYFGYSAANCVGLRSTVWSLGTKVDLTPPDVGSVIAGGGRPVAYQI